MDPIVIRVSAPRLAQVQARPVRPVAITPADGARVVVVPVPSPGPRGAPGEGTRVIGEVPGGVQNGINLEFATANSFRAASTTVYLNGLREIRGISYTESGPSAITFTDPPLSTDVVTIDYAIA